jgi:hypothetical protein
MPRPPRPSDSAEAAPAPRKKAKGPPRVAFPKRNQPPTPPAFAAQLPLASGKRFEAVRTFLVKQKDITEDVFFYGPRSGWGLRYMSAGRVLCALLIHGAVPIGIVSLDGPTSDAFAWAELSEVGQRARRAAHGSPSLLWLDVPLDGSGASDFKALVKAKVNAVRALAKTILREA